MSGLFGISEARAKEPEIDAVTYASGSEIDKAIAATKRAAPDAFERYLSRQNLLENGRNIKKIPPVPAKKPEYSFEKDPDYELIMRNINRMKKLEGVFEYGYKDTKMLLL